MVARAALVPLLLLVIGTPAIAAEEMKIEFAFAAPKPCSTVFPNPEIKMTHVPAGTHSVQIRFRREKNNEMGGQEVPFPSNGILRAETVRTFGPCNPGVYTYEVIAKSSSGVILAKAERSEPYPP